MKRPITIKPRRMTWTNSEHEKQEISWESLRKGMDIIVRQVLKITIVLLIYSLTNALILITVDSNGDKYITSHEELSNFLCILPKVIYLSLYLLTLSQMCDMIVTESEKYLTWEGGNIYEKELSENERTH